MERKVVDKKLALILENIEDGVFGIDTDGVTEFSNKAACELTGWAIDEVVGCLNHDLVHHTKPDGSHYPVHECPIYNVLKTGKKITTAHDQFWRKNGEPFDVEYTSSPMIVDGKIVGAVVVFRDITEKLKRNLELERYREKLEHIVDERTKELSEANLALEKLSKTDWLTGIANRKQFDDFLSVELKKATRQGVEFALILCDVDHFKAYNDKWGHQQGDECLIELAQVMQSTFRREVDLVARYGGEEFGIIILEKSSAIATLCEALRANIENANIKHNGKGAGDRVTVSIGCVTFQSQQCTALKTLIELADKNLYQAKNNGRNQFVLTHFSGVNTES